MLPPKRFYAVLFTCFVTALLFAFPRLYTTIKAMLKEDQKIEAPIQIIRETLSWSTKDKPSLRVEWTGICSTMNIAEKGDRPDRRKFYMGAKLTNESDKPMTVRSLEYLLMMDGVELTSQSFGISSLGLNCTIPAGQVKSFSISSLLDRDIVVGLYEGSIKLTAKAQFSETP